MNDFANLFGGAAYIHTYSRAQAIEDGVLVDVTEAADRVGFKYPVAITAGCKEAALPDDTTSGEALVELLEAAKAAAKASGGSDRATFTLDVAGERATKVTFLLTFGPGDTPAPVITVMLPEEE